MVEYLLVWLVTPSLLLVLSGGLGLILSVILRKSMNMALCLGTGFSLLIILGSLLVSSKTLTSYAPLIIGVIALLGWMVAGLRFRSYIRLDFLPGLVGVITYFAFGLPAMAYGKPTWAGWVKLDDTASWFAVTNRLMTAGHTVPSTVISTYQRLIQVTFSGNSLNYGSVSNTHFDYPIGAFVPFGVISKASGIERAWIFQPYLSAVAALGAMLLVLILRSYISHRAILVAMSCISMISSTMYSYVMWGGIKEIVLIVPLTLLAFTLFKAIQDRTVKEFYVYSIIAVLALYFIGGKTSLGFVAPILLIALLVKVFTRSRRVFYAFLAAIVILSAGAVFALRAGNNALGKLFVPEIKDSGNLSRSLNLLQTMGIWPSKDFRLDPVLPVLTYLAIGLAFCFLVLGIFYSSKKGLWVVPSLVGACVAVVLYSYLFAGIWITGKAIAVTSPLFLLAAGVGVIEVWKRVRNGEMTLGKNFKFHYLVLLLGVFIGSEVLLADAYTYRNVWLAPYPAVNELKTIGKLYAGQGPALMTEYSVFGARYFLRDLDAESASELRVHPIPMRNGNQVPRGFAADIGLFDPSTINNYKILVLRKSPVSSRPPLNYHMVWSGDHYEVWKRIDSSPVIKKMMDFGNNYTPGTQPSCSVVTTFLSHMTKGERIFTSYRDKTYLISFAGGDLPVHWIPTTDFFGAVERSGPGGFSRSFSVDQSGTYNLSMAGSFPGQVTLLVDGAQVYSGHSVLEGNPTLTNNLTRVELSAGAHVLTLIYKTPIWMPGSDVNSRFGPVVLSTQFAGDAKVSQVSKSNIPQLCTRNLDWLAVTN